MKPTDLDRQAIPGLEEAKEAVCDSLLNLTFERVSGFGPAGAVVYGRKPSRHFVSGFLLPGFDAAGEEDETSDIHLNTHGMDFGIARSVHNSINVSASISVYVRGLPEWDEICSPRHDMFPVLQPTAQLRREIKSAVKERLSSWRARDGKSASYQDYLAIKRRAYAEECRRLGLPTPSTDVDELPLQATEEDLAENAAEGRPTVDALYRRRGLDIPDDLAEPVHPPQVWIRVPVALGPWTIDFSRDLAVQQVSASDDIEASIQAAVKSWIESSEGQARAFREFKLKPSDCRSRDAWNSYLDGARALPVSLKRLLPDPVSLKLTIESGPNRRSEDEELVRVALEHHGRKPGNAQQPFFEPAVFQTALRVALPKAALRPMPLDRVEPSYRYRHYMTFAALGLNCGVKRIAVDNEIVLKTTWAPRYVLPRQMPRAQSTVPCDYASLSDPAFDIGLLTRLSEEYDTWTDELPKRIDPVRGVDDPGERLIERQNFEEDRAAYRAESADIARGVDLLERAQAKFRSDPEGAEAAPYRAWLMMNQTFREAGAERFVGWRLFQLAFILAQIPGFASRMPIYAGDFDAERDEETASLLYFATGGGKSEAFFGVLIYLLFLDRLRGKTFGVSALVRYPLRLLTVQQARRLFRLLLYAEKVRRRLEVEGAPFQLGFWVGAGNTPNSLGDERLSAIPFQGDPPLQARTPEHERYMAVRRAFNKVPTCPLCHHTTELRRLRDEGANGRHRLALMCLSNECAWNEGAIGDAIEPLPFLLVDEDIYARAPSVVLGTIDKLALIGQSDGTISKVFGMFGLARWKHATLDRLVAPRDARRNTPPPGLTSVRPLYADGESVFYDPLPSLVIQDEAHLLEESLGTFAGLFETTLEQVFRANSELFGDLAVRRPSGDGEIAPIRMPKIIAATATVSDPDRQIDVLYQRNCRQFPKPGPDLYESYYSHPKPPNDVDRLASLQRTGDVETFAPWSRIYASFMTNGATHTITTVNILAALHATITELLSNLWTEADPAAQTGAVDRLIAGLSEADEDPVSPKREQALTALGNAGRFDVIASLVDLHRVVLTYVTNKKGGDVVLDALQDVVRDAHRYAGLPDDELKVDLISGGVDMEGIERVMDEAKQDRTDQGDFVPLAEGLRNIVATSAISHGVDVDRFNAMVFAGVPSDIAEYIQASSRVGRAHVGFSLLVPTPQSRRDRYVVEVHEVFHRFLDRMISPPAVDRWAAHAIKRVMPSLFQAWLVGFVEPRLFSNAADKSKTPIMSRVADIRRYLEPVRNRDKYRSSFEAFSLGAIGVEGRGFQHIGEPDHKDYYRNLVIDEARSLFDLFVGPEGELGFTSLRDFWVGSTDLQRPMLSLRDVEEAGRIDPAAAPVGRKPISGYQQNVQEALRFLRRQRASGSELDDEVGG